MQVRDAMSTDVVTVGPTHTLRQVAKTMAARRVGSAVVLDGDRDEPGIITERDLVQALADGLDPDAEKVEQHLTGEIVVAAPDWSLEAAAQTMISGGFRHLVVCEDAEVVGIISVRDVVRLLARAPVSAGR